MQAHTQTTSSPLVTTDWLAAQLGSPLLRVFDCSIVRQDNPDGSYALVSGREQWNQSHIPGSAFLGLREELSDPASPTRGMMPPIERLAAILMANGVGATNCVVLYDSGNHACAARVWWMLRLCGFDNCFVLDGGWRKWCKEGRAVSSEPTCWPPGSFPIRPRPHLLADKQQVQAALGDNKTLLLHALPPPVFSGALKVFARAGRIPGSRNVFVALALVMLGCDNVALYDGSLADWTADPALPMETDFPQ